MTAVQFKLGVKQMTIDEWITALQKVKELGIDEGRDFSILADTDNVKESSLALISPFTFQVPASDFLLAVFDGVIRHVKGTNKKG